MIKKLKRNLISNLLEILWITDTLAIIFLILLITSRFDLFNLNSETTSVLSTCISALASIFAIVFSISLVAIQLFSENLGHRLLGLYIRDLFFIIPFSLNLAALLLDVILLTNFGPQFANYGIVLTILAIVSLVPFFVFTVSFLKPVNVVKKLLDKIEIENLLEISFSEKPFYSRYFQPIEDIVITCIQKGDTATAQDVIDLIQGKMNETLTEVSERIKNKTAPSIKLIVFMSQPFANVFLRIAIASNKKDSIETTIYIVNTIGEYIQTFEDARFIPAYNIFDATLDKILLQAQSRFGSSEYTNDLTLLEITVSSAAVKFGSFVG